MLALEGGKNQFKVLPKTQSQRSVGNFGVITMSKEHPVEYIIWLLGHLVDAYEDRQYLPGERTIIIRLSL